MGTDSAIGVIGGGCEGRGGGDGGEREVGGAGTGRELAGSGGRQHAPLCHAAHRKSDLKKKVIFMFEIFYESC